MRSFLRNRNAMIALVIGLVVTLAAVAVLIPVGVYLNVKLYNALPFTNATLYPAANQTMMAVRDNVYSAYSISAVIPIVAAAAVIIGIIVAAFSFRKT